MPGSRQSLSNLPTVLNSTRQLLHHCGVSQLWAKSLFSMSVVCAWPYLKQSQPLWLVSVVCDHPALSAMTQRLPCVLQLELFSFWASFTPTWHPLFSLSTKLTYTRMFNFCRMFNCAHIIFTAVATNIHRTCAYLETLAQHGLCQLVCQSYPLHQVDTGSPLTSHIIKGSARCNKVAHIRYVHTHFIDIWEIMKVPTLIYACSWLV